MDKRVFGFPPAKQELPLEDNGPKRQTQRFPQLKIIFMVVMGMKSCGGESAVLQTLYRVRKLYWHRMQATAAAEELASLFAECAITEASPNASTSPSTFNNCHLSGPSMVADASGTSILAKCGRMRVVMDAFADGSSFICLQCGGLVSNLRRDEHLAYWCCQAS